MPRQARGSVYQTRNGIGIRWLEQGQRRHQSGFRTKTEARDWWDENVKPRLRRGGPSAEITFSEFVAVYHSRWEPTVHPRTAHTLSAWLKPALKTFGGFTLRELEGAAGDIARFSASLPSDDKRHKTIRALRQVLAAAVRWGYMTRNPALVAGSNPAPRADEIRPFSRVELDRIVEELAAKDAAIVVFVAETGLRTNEWAALERRDIDRGGPAVQVMRRWSRNRPTAYPKTQRRRVPLTPRAEEALGWLPARLDSPLLFPSPDGFHLDLHNWSARVWKPALEAAGVEHRGAYHLRHTFATEALRAGVPVRMLSRLMGASIRMIEQHYGGWGQDDEAQARVLLAARSGVVLESLQK